MRGTWMALSIAAALWVWGCGGDDGGGEDASDSDDASGEAAGGDGDAGDSGDGSNDRGGAGSAAGEPADDAAGDDPSSSEDGDDSGDGVAVGERECDGDWPIARVMIEQEIADAINAMRETGGNCESEGDFDPADPLVVSAELEHSARCHAEYMASVAEVGFEDAAGNTFGTRAAASGYEGFPSGSAVAAATGTGQEIFDVLVSGPINCRSFLRPESMEMGIGVVTGDEGRKYVEVAIGQP